MAVEQNRLEVTAYTGPRSWWQATRRRVRLVTIHRAAYRGTPDVRRQITVTEREFARACREAGYVLLHRDTGEVVK